MRAFTKIALAVALAATASAASANSTASGTTASCDLYPPGETLWYDSEHPFAPPVGGMTTLCDCSTTFWGSVGMYSAFTPYTC